LDSEIQNESWLEGELTLDGYDISIEGNKFEVLKLVELTREFIGSVEDVRKYFNETENEDSPRFNPYSA